MTVLSTSQEQLDTTQSAIHRLACLLVVRLVQHKNHNMAALASQQEQMKIAQLKSYLHQMLERHPSNQKKIKFPKRSFGKTKTVYRSFQAAWFDRWSWFHHDASHDKTFCHVYVTAYKHNLIASSVLQLTIISHGFTNWKDETASKMGFPVKIKKEALDTIYERAKVVQKSPERDAKLQQIKEQLQHETSESSPGIRLFCHTRWTVRASAIHSIVENYPALKELWTWSLDNCSDTEMKARILGVDYNMMKCDFFYGLALGQCILRHADSLSTTLQRPNLSAVEGQSIVSTTVNTLSNLRSENVFTCFGLMS